MMPTDEDRLSAVISLYFFEKFLALTQIEIGVDLFAKCVAKWQ